MGRWIQKCIYLLILLCCLYQCRIAYGQWHWSGISAAKAICISGSFHAVTEFALLLALFLPAVFYRLLWLLDWKRQNWANRILAVLSLFGFIAISVMIVVTCCRSAWIAASFGCMVTLYMFLSKQLALFKPKATHLIGLCTGILLLIASVYPFKKNSADGRSLIWKVTIEELAGNPLAALSRHPTFSVFYGEAQEKYFKTKMRSERERMLAGAPDYAYNEFLQMIVEQGLLVSLLFSVLLFLTFRNLWKSPFAESVPLSGGMSAWLAAALFSYPLRCYTPCLLFCLYLLCAWSLSFRKQWSQIAFIAIGESCCLYFLMQRFDKTRLHQLAMQQYVQIENVQRNRQSEKLARCYKNLFPYLLDEPSFTLDYALFLYELKHYAEARKILNVAQQRCGDAAFWVVEGQCYQAERKWHKAESCYMKAFYRIPHKVTPLFLIMNIYKLTGEHKKMKDMARKIVKMRPKIKSKRFDNIQKEASQVLSSTTK